jgi:hypothetical protein
VPLECFLSRFGLSWVIARRVVDLYACWWTAGCYVEDGAFVPFLVFMEENEYRSFEDRERILEEIKSLFFNTTYIWTAFVSPLVINYHEFFVLFALTS